MLPLSVFTMQDLSQNDEFDSDLGETCLELRIRYRCALINQILRIEGYYERLLYP